MPHEHSVIDADSIFIIDGETREIKSTGPHKPIIQFDHNSEIKTFQMPRFIEGHDMMECNSVQVHFINTDKATRRENRSFDDVLDMAAGESEDTIYFQWQISSDGTQYVGPLAFLIRFSCVDDAGIVWYAWNTAINGELVVSDGIYNTKAVAEKNEDVLAQWRQDILQAIENGGAVKTVNGVEPDENGNIKLQSGVQPDWNQNDETAPDYVRNRPGGYSEKVTLLPETSIEYDGGNRPYFSNVKFSTGVEYTVIFDEQEYNLVPFKHTYGFYLLGNKSLTNYGNDTGEPFCFLDGTLYCATNGNHTVEVFETLLTDVLIPRRWLDDSSNVLTYNFKDFDCVIDLVDRKDYVAGIKDKINRGFIVHMIFDNVSIEDRKTIENPVYSNHFTATVRIIGIYISSAGACRIIGVTMPYTGNSNPGYNFNLSLIYIARKNNKSIVRVYNLLDILGSGAVCGDFGRLVTLDDIVLNSYKDINSMYIMWFTEDGKIHVKRETSDDVISERTLATEEYVSEKITSKKVFLASSKPDSTKKFAITVDDTGTISATEVTA